MRFFSTTVRPVSNPYQNCKSVKGKFIRFLAQNNIQSINEFPKLEYDGFSWDGEHFIKEIK